MRLCTFLIVAFSCVSLSAQIIEFDWILNSASVDSGFTNGDTNASFSKVIDLGNGQNVLVQLAVVSNDGLFIDSDGLGAGGDNSIDHFGSISEKVDFSISVSDGTQFLGWTSIPGKGMSYLNYDHPVMASNGITSFNMANSDFAIGETDFSLFGDIPTFSIEASSDANHGSGSVTLTKLTATAGAQVPEPMMGIPLMGLGLVCVIRRNRK